MIINVSKNEEIVTFRLNGKFISPSNRDLFETVEHALRGRVCYPKLLFDFKEVTRIDCAGLGTLMEINADILPRGGRIAIINMNKNIRNVTVMTQLSSVLECYKCENDAITMLSAPNEMKKNTGFKSRFSVPDIK